VTSHLNTYIRCQYRFFCFNLSPASQLWIPPPTATTNPGCSIVDNSAATRLHRLFTCTGTRTEMVPVWTSGSRNSNRSSSDNQSPTYCLDQLLWRLGLGPSNSAHRANILLYDYRDQWTARVTGWRMDLGRYQKWAKYRGSARDESTLQVDKTHISLHYTDWLYRDKLACV